MPIDWKKPYGIVYGGPTLHYMQDGIEYDSAGVPVVKEEPKPQKQESTLHLPKRDAVHDRK